MKLLFFILIGCPSTKTKIGEETIQNENQDVDGDGYLQNEDCDDGNSTISPNAIEICDGVDNDCDGEIDENVSETFFEDQDGDGDEYEDGDEDGDEDEDEYADDDAPDDDDEYDGEDDER